MRVVSDRSINSKVELYGIESLFCTSVRLYIGGSAGKGVRFEKYGLTQDGHFGLKINVLVYLG